MDRWHEEKISLRIGLFIAVVSGFIVGFSCLMGQKNLNYLPFWISLSCFVFGGLGWLFGEILRSYSKKYRQKQPFLSETSVSGRKVDFVLPAQTPNVDKKG